MTVTRIESGPVGPGKFEGSGKIGEYCYGLSLEGGCDDETTEPGDCNGWYGLFLLPDGLEIDHGCDDIEMVRGAILFESSQGFVDVTTYETEGEARAEFDRIAAECAEESEELEAEECE